MGKDKQYPTSDELDRLDRIHEAGKLEREAALQQNFGNRDQRRHERKRVGQEWERIKAEQEGGLPEERVWENHLRRMKAMAESMADAGKCRRRSAHLNREGLESAAKLFEDRAAQLEASMNPQVAKSFNQLSRLAIEKAEDEAQESALDQFAQELDATNLTPQDKQELQQLAEMLADMLGLGQGSGEEITKNRWQRADGSWWQTNPEGGKPIPWRPPHSSREGKEERKKATASLSPERRKAIGGLISQGEKNLITRAENELRKPTGYQKAATLPPNTTPEYKKANGEVGQFLGMSRAYLDRARGVKEGYGSSPKDRRFWAAMAMIMSQKTKKAAETLKKTPMLPSKVGAEGVSQEEAAARIGAAAQAKKPSESPIAVPAGIKKPKPVRKPKTKLV